MVTQGRDNMKVFRILLDRSGVKEEPADSWAIVKDRGCGCPALGQLVHEGEPADSWAIVKDRGCGCPALGQLVHEGGNLLIAGLL